MEHIDKTKRRSKVVKAATVVCEHDRRWCYISAVLSVNFIISQPPMITPYRGAKSGEKTLVLPASR